MIEIKEIYEPSEKSKICDALLRRLPDWFGIESAINTYVRQVKKMDFYAAYDDDGTTQKCVGFIALKTHNKFTCEIYVMGTRRSYQGKGIGRKLVEHSEANLLDKGVEFLTVKTLDGSEPVDTYKRTRAFYQSRGFKPLEVFDTLWENDPCLFMVKPLKARKLL